MKPSFSCVQWGGGKQEKGKEKHAGFNHLETAVSPSCSLRLMLVKRDPSL
jgi:hypothetical protein